jgi:hypothetical protein
MDRFDFQTVWGVKTRTNAGWDVCPTFFKKHKEAVAYAAGLEARIWKYSVKGALSFENAQLPAENQMNCEEFLELIQNPDPSDRY